MSTRGILAAAAVVVAAALSLAYWLRTPNGNTPPSWSSSFDNGSAAAEPKKLLDGWPVPAAALVLSGEQHGYLEPCGCSLTQSGGMARRADLFDQLQEQGWPVAAVDVGGTGRPRHENRTQSLFKFDAILASLGELPYEALALGPEELRLGAASLVQKANPNPDEPGGPPPFLAANVVLFDDPDFGTPLRSRVREVGGVKIGLTAVVGAGVRSTVFPEGAKTDIDIADPHAALPAVIEELQSQEVELLVLLSHADPKESRALAEQFPQFDLVLSAGGPEDPDGRPEFVGNTMLVTVGQKGKHVGVVGYYPGADERLRFELVDLDNQRFRHAASMDKHMQFYQDLLRNSYPQLADELDIGPHPSGAKFVGAEKCGQCHTKAYDKWLGSKHAHAYKSLIEGRDDHYENWIPRIHDPECLSCHVTGWKPQEVERYDSGFFDVASTPHLQGQQCENCHGPGSRHVELEELWKLDRMRVAVDDRDQWRRNMHLSKGVAKDNLCYKCHDLDNSPGFEFEKYWEKIRHPWKD